MNESVFYNILAIHLRSNYKALAKAKARYGSWSQAYTALKKEIKLDPEPAWHQLEQFGVALVLAEDPQFPPLLREVPFPPFGLYVRGSMLGNETKLAVVGTRRATPAGLETARSFAAAISAAGVTIVSGLAFGVDVASHQGTLEAGGKAVAVLASGCNIITPRSHETFGHNILAQGGTIISEYPLGTPARNDRFLERNRIVSGLSNGVLIIEAPLRSGTQATARFAIEQNREVFVVPGSILNPNYAGSHALIQSGASLVTSSDEVLIGLGKDVSKISEDVHRFQERNLNEIEKKIVALLAKRNIPLHSDEIVVETRLAETTVHESLTLLTIANTVKEIGGRYMLSH